MARPASALADRLARLTREGDLYEALPNGRVRCFACGHRCVIPPGFDGVCRVRFNQDGVLRVPWGYVGGVQVDPVEKKPFFHALPGARAFSFGMLGCDFHCGYCFPGETVVLTDRGATTMAELFASCSRTELRVDAEIGFPTARGVVTASGALRPLLRVFKHPYRGSLARVQPAELPPIRCTPDHRLYATKEAGCPPDLVRAEDLTPSHYLVVPRRIEVRGKPRTDAAEFMENDSARRDLPADGHAFKGGAAAIAVPAQLTTDDHYLLPIRSIGREDFDGEVYNLEVEGEHSYLAGLLAVSNCQNWLTSQALRDPDVNVNPHEIAPHEMVELARKHDARIMTSTYNEPLITSEWGMAVFREAKKAGLVCSYVSNGNGTPEVLDYIQPYVSLYKVDLKSFRDAHYRELGGTLERVLWTIRELHARGIWLEIVTLVIPGFNDSDEELREIAEFLVSVSPDIPWHVTAFHKDYKMTDPDNTSVATLLRAAEIGAAAGLRFVYAGNLPGRVGRWENTYCPGCQGLLIERVGYRIVQNRLAGGTCPDCGRAIPGFWAAPA